jgi:SAM-dependent methyltransferase
LPDKLTWLRCDACSHVFTDSFYTVDGLEELFRNAIPGQLAKGDLERQRILWAPVVERVLQALPERTGLFNGDPFTWLDVGCGSGGLVATADEFGFTATGLDLREEAVRLISDLGYQARCGDLLGLEASKPINVISMADLLEHTTYPVAVLRKAHALLDQKGVLFLSCPNRDSGSWRQMDRDGTNPYWREIEHHHNFSRKSLLWILQQSGFSPVSYSISSRYIACMEIVSVKVPLTESAATRAT